MYAAAGGASLASRQARKKQQQQLKNKANQQQLLREKLAQVRASAGDTPTKSRGFHQLPPGYLRPPQGQGRKLSATYTGTHGGSRLLLPINESGGGHASDDCHRSPHHSSHHHLLFGLYPGQNALHKSATATIPLVSHAGAKEHAHALESPPPTPNVCFPPQTAGGSDQFQYDGPNLGRYKNQAHRLHLPLLPDPIVTPATPIPSPGLHGVGQQSPNSQFERKCSVYKGRKLDPNDEHFYRTTTFQSAQEMYNEEFKNYVFTPSFANGKVTEIDYYCTDPEHKVFGVCTCEVCKKFP